MSDKVTKQAVATTEVEPPENAPEEICAQTEHPPTQEAKPLALEKLCEEQVARSVKAMEGDYGKADGKSLLANYVRAQQQLDQLKAEITEVGEYVKRPGFMEESRDLILKFFSEAYRITVYCLAVLQITTGEIGTKASRNAVNLHFGLLKVAISLNLWAAQETALRKLQALAHGIAERNGLFRSDGEHWNDPTNQAVIEQLRRFADLDWRDSLEFMIDNKFAVVGEAIKERMIDEVRKLTTRQSREESLDDKKVYESIRGGPGNPEDQRIVESIITALELSSDGLSKGVQRVVVSIAQTLREPDLGSLTESQLVEEIKKRTASVGDVSDRQARNNWNAFLESPEALAKTRQALSEIAAIKSGSK